MPNEMIERVAFSLVNKARAKHNVPLFSSVESMIENLTPEGLTRYTEQAKAAIEAMREPTGEMCNAAYAQVLIEDSSSSIFMAMIDAALKE